MAIPRIRGIPGFPEPTFRTHDNVWVSLDTVVDRVCDALGENVSPLVAKCTIQLARHALARQERPEVGALAAEVCRLLRPEHIVVTPLVVHWILLAYANEVAALDVAQVSEGWEPG